MPPGFQNDDLGNLLMLHDSADQQARDKGLGLSFKDLGRHDHKASSRLWIYIAIIVAPVFLAFAGLGIANALTQFVSR